MPEIRLLIIVLSVCLLISCEKSSDEIEQTEEIEQPEESLNFTLIASNFDIVNLTYNTGGMIGDPIRNNIYFGVRSLGTEEIHTYNVQDNTWSTNVMELGGFVTKRLHIINDELFVLGGQSLTKYELPVEGDAVYSNYHNLNITRYSSAQKGQNLYFLGNKDIGNGNQLGAFWKYDTANDQISELSTLSQFKMFAGAEIVGEHYYLFGGTGTFPEPQYEDIDRAIRRFDLNSGASTIINEMPEPAFSIHAVRRGNLIYVGYETRNDIEGDGIAQNDEKNINFAIYNTTTDTFTTLEHNIDDSSLYGSIAQMTILNDILYVAYQDPYTMDFEVLLYAAEL